MDGTLTFGANPFTITAASQISNLNASYAGIAYDLQASSSVASDAEVDNDLTISNGGTVDSTALSDGGTIGFEWVDNEVSDTFNTLCPVGL